MNGTEPSTAACCSAARPPTSSIAQAMPPISTPSTTITTFDGVSEPREARVAITTDAASAPLMKNRAISRTQSAELSTGTGSASSAVNSDSSGVAKAPTMSALPPRWSSMPVPPTTANQRNPKPVGAATTPITNSRIVRPREMRATNMPTKGAQETHQAQ